MSKLILNLQLVLPAIAAIAFGCAQQPAPVSPAVQQTATQAGTGQAAAAADANDYTVLARNSGNKWSGNKGDGGSTGNKWSGNKGGGGGSTGNKWSGNKGGGGGSTGNKWSGNKGGGGGWTGRNGGHHTYTYGNHWNHNYGWWGHGHRFNTRSWWGGGNWWIYGGTPWWGLGYEPSWLATASLVASQFVYLGGFYYPFYSVGGTIYPDYSRPFIFNGVTYIPYSGTTLTVPNQGEGIPAGSAQVVAAPTDISD